MAEPVVFRARYDRTCILITGVVIVALIGACAYLPKTPIIALAPLIVITSYAYSPRRYEIAPDAILIKRGLISDVRIELTDIAEARLLAPNEMWGAIRVFAVGGMFGYFGWFRLSGLGMCRFYTTDKSKLVLIRTIKGNYVVSPDDPVQFLAAIPNELDPIANLFTYQNSGKSLLIGMAGLVLALALPIGALFYNPGLPSYTLTSTSLTIHDAFYETTVERSAVKLEGIRIVDFRLEPQWKPTSRSNGFGNLRYHSGWFNLLSGEKIRMYRESGERLVLLPGAKGSETVLLEVSDPDAFLLQIQREWQFSATSTKAA